MDVINAIGEFYCATDLARRIKANRIQALGPIEGDPRDAQISAVLCER